MESVILFMSVSLLGMIFFFLIKETHSSAYSLLVTSRCAIRGKYKRWIRHRSEGLRLNGMVQGVQVGTISRWKGIPYAEYLVSGCRRETAPGPRLDSRRRLADCMTERH